MPKQRLTLPPTPEETVIQFLATKGIILPITAEELTGEHNLSQLIKEATH